MKKNYHVGISNPTAIFLPFEVREALNLKQGKDYEIEVKDNSIIFTDPITAKRQEWIDYWYDKFRFNSAAHMTTMNNITAVETYGQIGISKPSRGDKYDKKTGIAVAYAKTCGADIPKYI